MTQIFLDASLAQQLHSAPSFVELCDPSGRVLGTFVPNYDRSDNSLLMPAINEAELDRREQAAGVPLSTADVLAHLRNL